MSARPIRSGSERSRRATSLTFPCARTPRDWTPLLEKACCAWFIASSWAAAPSAVIGVTTGRPRTRPRSRCLSGCHQAGCCSENHTAICVREFTPSLFSKLCTCVSTVRTERKKPRCDVLVTQALRDEHPDFLLACSENNPLQLLPILVRSDVRALSQRVADR